MSQNMEWEKAKSHFDEVRQQYIHLQGVPGVNVEFALRLTFEPLTIRYNGGERTQELYEAMLAVE